MNETEKTLDQQETPATEETSPVASSDTQTIDQEAEVVNQATDVVENEAQSQTSEEAPSEAEANTLSQPAQKRRKHRRKRIDEYTLDNDMRFRGPLSYRHLRILAWFFLIVAQVGVILALGAKFDGGLARKVGNLPTYLKMATDIMMPLFLVATFATILNGSRSFRSMLIFYGGAALLFYGLFMLFHERYIPIILGWVMGVERTEAIAIVDLLLTNAVKGGYLAFNIFVDLFLCTWLTFFMIYKPRKVFTGKKEIIFRLLVIIPIGYEIACFVIKLLGALGNMTVSPYLYPLLPTKPPMTFLVFVAIALFLKVRERIYRKRGKTHEEYQEFLKTKANSWQFSKFTARIMIIAGILDIIIYLVLTLVVAAKGVEAGATEEVTATALQTISDAMLKAGIGGSTALIVAAPIMLLFSYSRPVKKSSIDLLLPIFALIVLAFVYLEALVIATGLIGPFGDFIGGFFH